MVLFNIQAVGTRKVGAAGELERELGVIIIVTSNLSGQDEGDDGLLVNVNAQFDLSCLQQ